jgi:hypothetical protein
MINVSNRALWMTNNVLTERDDIYRVIKFLNPNESEVYRDKFGSIAGKGLNYVELKSFPLYINPSQKQKDRAGVKEHITAIFYISYEEYLEKLQIPLFDIIRHRIEVNFDGRSRQFDIDTAIPKGNITDNEIVSYRYLIFGCTDVT